ncbi:MAG: SCO family protein [Vicinamibacteraceae bacterium]|nr:SCO family protein [Vicinamibacteraceae bacterium]
MRALMLAAAVAVVLASGACNRAPDTGSSAAGEAHEAGDGHAHEATGGPVTLDLYEFGGDFALTAHDGAPFRLADARGKVVLLFFGYASCPDVCPTTLATVSSAMKQLGDRSSEVLTVFVSVDPERDTPEVLREYIDHFRIPAVAVTGSTEDLDRIVSQYKAYYEKVESDSAMGYLIDHTAIVYVIDREGRVRFLHRYGDGAGRLAEAVQLALRD